MLGTTPISKLYYGTTVVTKAYTGNTVVYSPSTQEFLLDTYGSAEFAYSFRELTANRAAFTSIGDTGTQLTGVWTVQVRRSSDNEQKSFRTSEITDGTLLTWVGAGNNGYVSRWYDQSGNSNHGYQTTTARQPSLVLSGTLNTENGVPAMRALASVDNWLNITTPTVGDMSIFSSYRAFYPSSLIIRHTGGSAHGAGSRGVTSTHHHQTNIDSYDEGNAHTTNPIIANYEFVGTAQSIHENNNVVQSRTASGSNICNIARIFYFRQQGGTESSMSEFVHYATNKSVDRSGIFNNMNAFYGAY